MKITIGHLYPVSAEFIRRPGKYPVYEKRLEWRGIEASVKEFSLTDPIDFAGLDIVLLGGGSDREQMLVCRRLQEIKKDFRIMWKTEAASWRYAEAISFWAIITTQMRAG